MSRGLKPSSRLARLAALLLPALALVACAAALNIWVVAHPQRFDLTSGGVYSIGPQTRKVLTALREPVTVTFFHDLRSKEMGDALALLKQYAAVTPQLTLKAFDPALAPAEARRQQVQFAGTAVFEAGGRRVVVNGGSEADFTSGLIRVTAQGNQGVCFTEGHVEADPDSLSTHDHFEGEMGSGHSHSSGGRTLVVHERHGMGMARDALLTLGYQVRSVALVRGTDQLAGCTVVVIAAPQQAFAPAEVEQLRRWALDGGRLIALVDPFVASGLDPLFADFRLQLEPRLVFDDKSHYWTDAATPAVTSYPKHKITRNLALTFFPGAASLAPLPMRAGDAPGKGGAAGAEVKLTPLVQTSDVARSEAIGPGGKPPDAGMQTIAVLATRKLPAAGTGQDERRAELLLIGDGDFASNSFFHVLGNGALFLNAVSYLAEQDRLIDITPRNYELPRLQMSNGQMRATFILSTLVMPALALGLSLLAWWRRRRG
jgi:ABC-type uncharacterized transport system involved in gliding motility auxiliary subunit